MDRDIVNRVFDTMELPPRVETALEVSAYFYYLHNFGIPEFFIVTYYFAFQTINCNIYIYSVALFSFLLLFFS